MGINVDKSMFIPLAYEHHLYFVGKVAFFIIIYNGFPLPTLN